MSMGRGGGGGGGWVVFVRIWWSPDLQPSAAGNLDNPVSGIHQGTVTKYTYPILTKGRTGKGAEINTSKRTRTATRAEWDDLNIIAVKGPRPALVNSRERQLASIVSSLTLPKLHNNHKVDWSLFHTEMIDTVAIDWWGPHTLNPYI